MQQLAARGSLWPRSQASCKQRRSMDGMRTCCAWMVASHVEGHKVGDGSWDERQYVAHSI